MLDHSPRLAAVPSPSAECAASAVPNRAARPRRSRQDARTAPAEPVTLDRAALDALRPVAAAPETPPPAPFVIPGDRVYPRFRPDLVGDVLTVGAGVTDVATDTGGTGAFATSGLALVDRDEHVTRAEAVGQVGGVDAAVIAAAEQRARHRAVSDTTVVSDTAELDWSRPHAAANAARLAREAETTDGYRADRLTALAAVWAALAALPQPRDPR